MSNNSWPLLLAMLMNLAINSHWIKCITALRTRAGHASFKPCPSQCVGCFGSHFEVLESVHIQSREYRDPHQGSGFNLQ